VTDAFLVIDSRRNGLPDAPAYYAAFPQEPSPFGMLAFAPARTALMDADASLFRAVLELAKAGRGAAALVCHAFSDGLLLPVAPRGTSVFATSQTMNTIDKLIDFDAEHDRIRALPQTSDTERKAVIDRWEALFKILQWPAGATPVSPPANFTDDQAEKVYQQWLTRSMTALEFRSTTDLREFFKRVKALRTAHLDRVELRACNIGGAPAAMDRVRKFFGCERLTAPTRGTFFGVVPVGGLFVARRARGARGPTASAVPLGRDDSRDAAESLRLMTSADPTRGFLGFSSSLSVPGPIQSRLPSFVVPFFDDSTGLELFHGFHFVLRIKEIRAFHYEIHAWAGGSSGTPAPDPAFVRKFCAEVFKADTRFNATALPLAGLWTPGLAKPFVFPLEPEYLPLIAQSPAPPPKIP
jgi:hypothetical protein